jgi:hypothetical protein
VAVASTTQFKRTSQALRSAGGAVGSRRTVKSDTFVSSTDTQVMGDTSGGPVNMRLYRVSEYPTARTKFERKVGASNFTITCRGSDTIDGSASITVTKTVEVGPVGVNSFHIFNTSA